MNSRTAARAIPAAELKDLAKRAFVRTGLSDDAAARGTNPPCGAIPAGHGPDRVLDMATSAGSKGSIRQAMRKGTAIPADWALTIEGIPTTDPKEALEGLLLPFGGAKGYGIALM